MKRNRDVILVSAAALAMFGACSHTATKRLPASDSSDAIKVTANFTLVQDKEVERVTRIYHGTPNSKVERVTITNPDGKVACQAGMPTDTAVPPSQSGDYTFDVVGDQDITCYTPQETKETKDVKPQTKIQATYQLSKSIITFDDVLIHNYDQIQQMNRDIEAGNYTPELISYLDQFEFSGDKERKADEQAPMIQVPLIVILPNTAQKDLHDRAYDLIEVKKGDYLEFNGADGALGKTKRALERTPIKADGLAQTLPHLPTSMTQDPAASSAAVTSAPAAVETPEAPVKHNATYIFPDERPHRLICALYPFSQAIDDGQAAILYRGGQNPRAYTDKEGIVSCVINVKKKHPESEHLIGSFNAKIRIIRKDKVLEQLKSEASSREQARATFEQKVNEANVASAQSAVDELVKVNTAVNDKYTKIAKHRQELAETERRKREDELKATDSYFPNQMSLQYRKGAHQFRIVPTKKTVPTSHGSADYVDYVIQDGVTPYYGTDDTIPPQSIRENVFAPVSIIPSAEHWGDKDISPVQLLICPQHVQGAASAVNFIVEKARQGTMPTRESITKLIGKFGAKTEKDCEGSFWKHKVMGKDYTVYQPFSFQRVQKFRFCYAKDQAPGVDGRDKVDMTAYVPSRIEALYTSPAGVTTTKVFGPTDNNARGVNGGHNFFDNKKMTSTPFTSAASLPDEVCVESRTLFPNRTSDGIIEGFSLTSGNN